MMPRLGAAEVALIGVVEATVAVRARFEDHGAAGLSPCAAQAIEPGFSHSFTRGGATFSHSRRWLAQRHWPAGSNAGATARTFRALSCPSPSRGSAQLQPRPH